ncbi:MAG: hypothetical protein A2166_06205 [Omnitrophica WOR_2 bacterium RBG_13_41_10]|nr:MAG: hypothetical protein A2166_06205 [Omnitrophica WOR_2 bacterium RBG_13_41_10]
MVNQNIIKAKIGHIESNLQRLKEKQNITLNELKKNKDAQDIIIHNLQLSIQGCIDIASHIISDQSWPVPDTLAGLFEILMEHEIISEELSNRLKEMVGFRNIIIHEYGTLDLDKVYNILNQDIQDIYSFMKQVCIYAKI